MGGPARQGPRAVLALPKKQTTKQTSNIQTKNGEKMF
jgi:hypothetical protein